MAGVDDPRVRLIADSHGRQGRHVRSRSERAIECLAMAHFTLEMNTLHAESDSMLAFTMPQPVPLPDAIHRCRRIRLSGLPGGWARRS